MNGYRQRIAHLLLKDKLDAFGAVLIEGPKWWVKILQRPNNKLRSIFFHMVVPSA